MKVLDRGRLHVPARATGMHRRILREALDYAVRRKQFGPAIAEFQLVQGINVIGNLKRTPAAAA